MATDNKALTMFNDIKNKMSSISNDNDKSDQDIQRTIKDGLKKFEATTLNKSDKNVDIMHKTYNETAQINKHLISLNNNIQKLLTNDNNKIRAAKERNKNKVEDKNRFSAKPQPQQTQVNASIEKPKAESPSIGIGAASLTTAAILGTMISDDVYNTIKPILTGFNFLKALKPLFSFGKAGKTAAKGAGLLGKAGGKLLGKAGKTVLKKIPGIGLIAGVAFGTKRFADGDFEGGLLEIASGLASIVPGIGTMASVAIDSYLAFKDLDEGGFFQTETGETVKSFGTAALRSMPVIGTFLRVKDAMELWKTDKKAALIEYAKAFGTMIPGAGLVISFMEEMDKGPGNLIDKAGGAISNVASSISNKLFGNNEPTTYKGTKQPNIINNPVSSWRPATTELSTAGQMPGPVAENEDVEEVNGINIPKQLNENQIKRTRDNINTLDPAFAKQASNFVQNAWMQGLPVVITQGLRGKQDQEKAYKEGKSKAAFGQSYHNYGRAFDIAVANGSGNWFDPKNLEAAGQIGKSLGLRWGGDFKGGWDKPHFEDSTVTIAELAKSGAYMAADGAVLNRPIIAGEAGPEAIIPLNDNGIGVIAEAMNRAININGSVKQNKDQSMNDLKSFLVGPMAVALAKEIVKAQSVAFKQKNSGSNTTVNAFG